jgi:AcrR family transcriptional regulator
LFNSESDVQEQIVDRVTEKRRRILDAARFLVLRQGLRGTTMEAIAREARIAKPTLYAQFADKDAVYTGIMDELVAQVLKAYEAGMTSEASAAERIGAGLAGMYGTIARMLEGSPHGDELYNEHYRAAGRFKAVDDRLRAEISAELKRAGVEDAQNLARLLLAAAFGIARKMSDPGEIEAGIRLLCLRMIG